MRATIFFCFITLAVIVGILTFLRSKKIKEKYAVLWLLIGVVCLVLVLFPKLLTSVAHLVGIELGSNLLFTLAILLLLGICLQLCLEVSSEEEKIRRLAEEVAILRVAVEKKEQGEPLTQIRQPSPGAEGGVHLVQTADDSTHLS